MDIGFGTAVNPNAGVVSPVQHAFPISEGGTISVTTGQVNAAILLDPSGPRNTVTVLLPNPAKDGQILTIGSTQAIQLVQFVPPVPSSPGMWDAGDAFQIKWFDVLNRWVLIK